jgi:hypothetical protein
MATRQNFLIWDSSTDANFRSWGSAISAALAATGWTATTDTGQINWTTVTTPAVATFAGYEVWKWSDTNQTACPVYMKIRYGNNANATKGPMIEVTVATGSDGAGNLTGNSTGAIALVSTGDSLAGQGGVNTFECDYTNAAGRFGMLLYRDLTAVNGAMFLSIERSCDNSGAYTASYVTVTANKVGGNCNQWTLMAQGTGGVWRVNNNTNTMATGQICCASVSANTTATTFGTNTAFSPVFPLLGKIDNPCRNVGVVKTGDQSEGATFTVNLYGVSHTFLYSKHANFAGFGASTGNNGVAMRWE